MNNVQSKIVSIMQCIAVLLVVLGHSIEIPVPNKFFLLLHKFIYSFHMPLFMILSGYLFYFSKDRKYLDHVKNKYKRLIKPYIIISSLVFIPRVLLNDFNKVKVNFSISNYFNNLIYPWDNVITQFWFLPTLFIIFLIAPILKTKKLEYFKEYGLYFLLVLSFLLHIYSYNMTEKIFNLKGICFYVFYFVSGFMIAYIHKNILEIFISKYVIYYLLFIISNTYFLTYQEHQYIIFNIFVAFINSIFIFDIARVYVLKKLSFLDFCEGYYYHIYLFSWLPLKIIVILFYKILHINSFLLYVVEFICSVLFPLKIKKYIGLILR